MCIPIYYLQCDDDRYPDKVSWGEIKRYTISQCYLQLFKCVFNYLKQAFPKLINIGSRR